MSFAQGSRSQLSYIVESSFGTTPGTPQMRLIPFTTHSLDLTKQRVQGSDIQADRMPRVDRHGNRNAGGDIVVDFRATDYDDFLESAFFNTLGTSGAATLKIGTTPQYLTIEDGALDVAEYRQFTGMAVSQMSMSIAPNQMVRCTFSMVGKDLTHTQTSLDGTPTAISGNEPFDSFNGTLTEGGGAIAYVTGLNFTLTNSLAPTFVIGSQVTPQLEYGMAVVEGTVTVYYQDDTLIDKFLDETESSLAVEINDTTSAGSYTFTFPRIKYNGASVPLNDPQSRIVTLPFVALYDTSSSTNLQLTKAA